MKTFGIISIIDAVLVKNGLNEEAFLILIAILFFGALSFLFLFLLANKI